MRVAWPLRVALVRWLRVIALCAIVLAGYALLAPRIPVGGLAAYVIGFGCVVASALAVAWHVPRVRPREVAWPIALSVLALLVLRAWPLSGLVGVLCVAVALWTLGSASGAVVGSAIEHPGHLLFVALVSALVDVLSVAHPEGPSAMIASSETALSLLAVSWPMLGTSNVEPMLGVGDVVFAALYVTASRVHELPMSRTAFALGVGFCTAMFAVLITELPVPALPFLGFAVIVAQPRARTPLAADRTRGFAVVAGLFVVVAALLLQRFF